MRSSRSVQLAIEQSPSGQKKRRFSQIVLVGRPKFGRSTSSTRSRPLDRATTPQAGQPTSWFVVSIVITRPCSLDSSETSRTSSRPTNTRQSPQDVGSRDTGALLSVGVDTHRLASPRAHVMDRRPRSITKCPFSGESKARVSRGWSLGRLGASESKVYCA